MMIILGLIEYHGTPITIQRHISTFLYLFQRLRQLFLDFHCRVCYESLHAAIHSTTLFLLTILWSLLTQVFTHLLDVL